MTTTFVALSITPKKAKTEFCTLPGFDEAIEAQFLGVFFAVASLRLPMFALALFNYVRIRLSRGESSAMFRAIRFGYGLNHSPLCALAPFDAFAVDISAQNFIVYPLCHVYTHILAE